MLLEDMGEHDRALPLLEQALEIDKKQLGPEHPSTADSMYRLASLLKAMGRLEEALPLFERDLAICYKRLGPAHPNTKQSEEIVKKLRRQLEAVV